ncbi:hypothetical protein [Roseibium album]|uniref:EF hand n=1 Tax=Roseibium album TaxID=311410 RepID=A0A0M7AQV9_9HYPH|nr:hypothetical protein [Roseibium album]CTQ59719.1 EF hand [Roseibium album]CTQ76116.1 EF hand [Roseibium album]CTQ76640.1 EF hand [Roseibium album]
MRDQTSLKFHRHFKPLWLGICVLFASATPMTSVAAQEFKTLRDKWMVHFAERVRETAFLDNLVMVIHKIDRDDHGISQDDIDLFRARLLAEKRANTVSGYLKYDLNGDFVIDREEIATVSSARIPKRNRMRTERNNARIESTIQGILQKDPNQDGKITLQELAAISTRTVSDGRNRQHEALLVLEDLLELDPDNSGTLSAYEAAGLMRAILKDGTDAQVRARIPGEQDACEVPVASAEADVHLVGASKGTGVSSVTVSGQDRMTSVAKINIEAGETPLYLILTSQSPMIWQLTGALNRLENVVLSGRENDQGKIMAGATGLSGAKATFVSSSNCISHVTEKESVRSIRAWLQSTDLVGTSTVEIHGHSTIHELALPSGEYSDQPPKTARDGKKFSYVASAVGVSENSDHSPAVRQLMAGSVNRQLMQILLRFNPGGVVSIAKEAVSSDVEARYYELLPIEAGLAQLVAAGKLEPVRFGHRDVYRVLDAIRVPSGLAGSQSVSFILPEGVAQPTGNPGNSMIVPEEDLETLNDFPPRRNTTY